MCKQENLLKVFKRNNKTPILSISPRESGISSSLTVQEKWRGQVVQTLEAGALQRAGVRHHV